MTQEKSTQFETVITSNKPVFSIDFKELWRYRDLLLMFVKREIIVTYKQTILGPIWFIVQPVLTSLMYIFVFGNIAGISTNGAPQILFYLSGVAIWTYFATCLNSTATVFKDNQGIFGKVYFPRLIIPLSIVISNLVKFFIQFGVFLLLWFYYIGFKDFSVQFGWEYIMLPILVVIMAALSMGIGLIITSLTTKYRDLIFLLQFGVQLFMFASPVIYPYETLPENIQNYMQYNPMCGILEGFKQPFLSSATEFPWHLVTFSAIISLVLFAIGALVYNRMEKNFMDTV